MLEGLLAGLLNRFGGMYIKNFDPTQVKVGVWQGSVKLHNLELRKEALDQLKLPLNVVEGHVGELTLSIPWTNLAGAPVKVFIENVFLLCSPKEEQVYDEEEEERRRQRLKMEKLESAELLRERAQEGLTQEEEKRNQGFYQQLVNKIIDNLQVSIKNIHVRYEDSIAAPGHPFALGITLEEISAVSTDAEWNPAFIQNSKANSHKLATLGALAVYWNTDAELLGTGREVETPGKEKTPHDVMLKKFEEMIVKAEDDAAKSGHQFVLKPVSGKAKIIMDKSGNARVPKYKVSLLFDEIGVVLDDNQYRDGLMMVDLFHYFIRHQEYKKFRPKGVSPKEDPRAWFRAAGNAVLSKIHERNRRWTWDYMRERRDDRIRYIELFKKTKQNQQLTPEESEDLKKLEWKLQYEELRFWRSLARNQLKKENAEALKNQPPKPPQQQQQQQGWLSWMWGGGKQQASTTSSNSDPSETTVMTEEQRRELYSVIEYDEKTALADVIDLPRDSVKIQVDASLTAGSFTLKQGASGTLKDLLSLHFDVFRASALVRPDSYLADISLGGLRVNDGTTPNSLFPEIVRVKDAPETDKMKQLTLDELEEQTEQDPFFRFQVELNPLDGQGDIGVMAKLKPLEIIWNPNCVVGIVDFFRPPERHMESITALLESAGATVEELREQTRAGFMFALEEHKTINAKLDLQAPLIIVPQSVTTRTSTCLILDAGHISVTSELVDKSTIKDLRAKQGQFSADEDDENLKSLMYDRFLVKLTSTQLLIGPSIDETKAQLIETDDAKMMHIVNRINFDLVVEMSILPKDPNLTKLKVSGHLPVLHAIASDAKYKSLMRIIDVAIPKIGDDASNGKDGDDGKTRLRPSRRGSTVSTLSNRSSRSRTRHERSQSRKLSTSQFPFFTKDTAIVLDDADDDEGQKYEDAVEGNAAARLKTKQKMFELKFTVDELRGSLYKSDPEGRKQDMLLVDLVAEHFGLEFYLRPFDMSAEVSLGSVTMEDFVSNPSAEFKSIISSGDVEDQEVKRDLVHVKYVKVKKESPEFMHVYDGVETNVTCAISTINVVVTRKTMLTLLDFILTTFTNNGNANANRTLPRSPDDNEPELAVEAPPEDQAQEAGSIRVKVELKSIRMILNNDGIRLATIAFNHADVHIFLLGKSMRIGARLGDLSLIDDVNQGVSADSSLRKLVTIQGDELADFRYETFDAGSEETYPGYDSSVFLRAGSVKVTFLEEPFRKIIDFLVKFGKMQALYNAARQAAANQANQLQQSNSRIKFDVVVRTPIVVFPRVVTPGRPKRDLLTCYLGEIYAKNKFAPLDDTANSQIANKISAGIQHIRVTSLFHYHGDEEEELELIDRLDLDFNITSAEHRPGTRRPDTEIEGTMSDLNLRITQHQLRFLLEISRSVPAAFTPDVEEKEEEAAEAVDDDTVRKARSMPSASSGADEEHIVDLGPELVPHDATWTKLDLSLRLKSVGLELIMAPKERPVGNVDKASLSSFSLNDSRLKMRMLDDGSVQAEFVIQAFTIHDTRPRDTNKFRRIMASSNKNVQQFMASLTMTGGTDRSMVVVVAVDSPRVIFALDYLFAIQRFVSEGLEQETLEVAGEELGSSEESDADSMTVDWSTRKTQERQHQQEQNRAVATTGGNQDGKQQSQMSIAIRVNIVDAQVILIANPLSASSEAIVLGVKQVLLSQQNALTFQVSQIGMFLCRMDRFDTSRLRIIDDFSIQMSMDSSQKNLTQMHIDIQPLVLRLSLRDILLALGIISKAAELSSGPEQRLEPKSAAAETKARQLKQSGLKQRTPSGKGTSTITQKHKPGGTISTARRASAAHQPPLHGEPFHHEELTASVEGVRVVLIGDLHELPILDMSIREFTVHAQDWASNLKADVAIDMYTNVYNFSKSAWEPLIEPWTVGVGVAREQATGLMSIDVHSRKTFDITITTATMMLASQSFAFLTQEGDVLDKPRGVEAPYKMRNYTGFDVVITARSPSNENITLRLADGEEAPWSFEHWEKMRENLLAETSSATTVAVQLEASGFDPVKNIRVNREGESLYSLRLRPRADDDVTHKLAVEVRLGPDNIKYITLRSPLLVENHTQIPVELGVYDPVEGNLLKIEKIAPGDSRPAPVGAVYLKSLLVRPDSGFGYGWSTETLWWRDLLKRPTRTMVCRSENGGDPFYFQLSANFDRADPLTKKYPYMRLKLSPPVVIENLLPYDFKYRIYDKNTKKDWSNFLRKGGVSPVHVVQLSHLLVLSIDMQDTVFKASDFAIINVGSSEDFRKEDRLVCRDAEGLTLNLGLHYHGVPNSGGAFRVTVYSPYVILNKTGLDLSIRAKGFLQPARAAAGQPARVELGSDQRPKATPFMFSFQNEDHRNRAMIRVADSEWSKPQSFDAIGSTTDVVMQVPSRNAEIHVGITVKEGQGKYKMTKLVTLAPRFIIENRTGEDLQAREPSSSSFVTLRSGGLQPLQFLQRGGTKQLSLCYPGVDNPWTAPFNISDLGTTYVKIARPSQRQKLVKVEILMEDGTIFVHLSLETKNWPFAMRNESDTEFTFYQANPNVDEEGIEDRSGFKPIRYRLPPRSIMPYAWDYPAAKFREVVISAYGRERHVKLLEIGAQVPMKLVDGMGRQKIIDINVTADGPTQTLILSNFRPSRSMYKQKSGVGSGNVSSSSSSAGGFEVREQDVGETMRAQLRLSGIGISLINTQLKELAYITFRDVHLKYNESPLLQTASLAIKWIQVDNQLYGGLFPMVLYPSVVPKKAQEIDAHPSLHAMVSRVKDDSYGVLYIKYATLLLQQMTVELDEDFVFAVLDFAKWASGQGPAGDGIDDRDDGSKLCDDDLDLPEPTQHQSAQDIYFEVLNIQPMQLDLSFMRTERVNAEDKSSSRNPLMFFFNVITMSIGNVNDAPIRLNTLLLENARVSVPVLVQNISNHYSQEVLYQVHKIIGSADFLGNPVGLFNNISSGLTDIFYEPYQGLIMSDRPEDLGYGIAKGAASFVKKSVYGFSDSFSKFTGSLSKGLAAATMDKQFQDRRRITRARNRPKHALYGVTTGANSFFTSVASGAGGLVRKPLEGAEQEGALGFLKGVGKGVVGLATKPAIGVLDLASNLSEGIRNTTTVFDGSELDRVRLARFVPADGIVRPYSARDALGQSWLKQVDNGRYFDERYIAHLELPGEDAVVMVTYSRILMIRSRRLTTEWDVPLKDIQTISRERTGINIMLRGGASGPFIPIAEESSRAYLYRMIAVAVEEFNRRFRGE